MSDVERVSPGGGVLTSQPFRTRHPLICSFGSVHPSRAAALMHAPNPVFKSMRTAFLADIHANREAFAAVMADVKSRGVDQIVFLGDIVGYGADPEWCVDQVMLECSKGAIAVLGNHDAAVANVRDQMSVN